MAIVAKSMAEYASLIFRYNVAIIHAPKGSGYAKTGIHPATELARAISVITGIPFYEDVLLEGNKSKMNPVVTVSFQIKESNVIFVDDVLTTGKTLLSCVEKLEGKNVLPLVALTN